MKIIFLGDGNSIHLRRWIEFFISNGNVVYLLATNTTKPIKKLHIIYLSFNKIFSVIPIVSTIVNALYLKKIVRKIRPDIIHAHYISNYGYMGALINFHPYIVTVWGSDWLIDPQKSLKNKMRVKYALKRADFVITNNKILERDIGRKRFVAKEKICSIHWGVNLKIFKKINNENMIKEKLKIPNNHFVMVSPRMLNPLYNIDIIIKAFSVVSMKNKFLIIMGKGTEEKRLKELVKKYNLQKKVLFTKMISNEKMNEYYNISDLLISIPSSDAISVSVLEGMAVGLPVIIGRIKGINHWFKNEYNGFILEKRTPDALAKLIEDSIKNSSLLKRISENNMRYIKENFDEKIFQKKMMSVYNNLVKGHK